MSRNITSIESILLTQGKKGQVFYTHKNDKDMTAIANYYKRKITTERGIFVSGHKLEPKVHYLTKVVIGKKKKK